MGRKEKCCLKKNHIDLKEVRYVQEANVNVPPKFKLSKIYCYEPTSHENIFMPTSTVNIAGLLYKTLLWAHWAPNCMQLVITYRLQAKDRTVLEDE